MHACIKLTSVPIASLGVVFFGGVARAVAHEDGAGHRTRGGVVVGRLLVATHLRALMQIAVVTHGVRVSLAARVHAAVALVPVAFGGVVIAFVVAKVIPQKLRARHFARVKGVDAG